MQKNYLALSLFLLLGLSCWVSGAFALGTFREKLKERKEDRKEIVGASVNKAGDHKFTLRYGGKERFFLLHVPPSYDKMRPAPLVLMMHGGGSKPEGIRKTSGMDAIADRDHFIVAYPAGTAKRFSDKLLTWGTGVSDTYADSQNTDDVGFLSTVIDDISGKYNIDPKRIYAAGLSQGAMMSYRLACEVPEKIAAIGPVAGMLTFSNCDPRAHVSVIHFHGTEDSYIFYNGGKNLKKHTIKPILSAPETARFWSEKNGLSSLPVREGRVGSAEFRQYGPGEDGAEVVLWTLPGCGHNWPGASGQPFFLGKVNQDISASELIWDFFKNHPKK